MSATVPTADEFAALATRVAELEALLAEVERPVEPSPFLTVAEAAVWLRTSRGAVDHLLSAGRLARYKVGTRTLVARADLEALAREEPRRRR